MRLANQRKIVTVFGALVALCLATTVSAADLSTYTAIPDVKPDTSYVRLYGLSGATDFEFRAFGNNSGSEYTTQPLTIHVLSNTSPQVGFNQLNSVAVSEGSGDLMPRGPDTALTLYVRSKDQNQSSTFQHIRFSATTGRLENSSVCSFSRFTSSYKLLNKTLMNIHTSALAGYPSFLGLTNPDSVSRKIQAAIFDASNGQLMGVAVLNVGPTTSAQFQFSELERQIGWTPSSSQLHANVMLDTADTQPYDAIASHIVRQQSSLETTNLTQVCLIEADAALSNVKAQCDPAKNPQIINDEAAVSVGGLDNVCAVPDCEADRSTGCYVGLEPSVDGSGDDSGASGQIASEADVDWWGVNLIQGRTYAFLGANGSTPDHPCASQSVSCRLNLTVRLRDPKGVLIPGMTASSPLVGSQTIGFTYENTPRFSFVVPTDPSLPDVQKYFVEVTAQPAVDGSKTGLYQLVLVRVATHITPINQSAIAK